MTPFGCVGGDHSINTVDDPRVRARTLSGGPEGAGTSSKSRDSLASSTPAAG